MIEEIYTYRFSLKSQNKQSFALFEATIELLSVRFNRIKAKVDQTSFDLLASVEQHKDNNFEV